MMKRALGAVLVSCMWVCALPGDAQAQAKFGETTCNVQKINMDGKDQWQIKGATSVTGLNPQGASTTVLFTFQRMVKGSGTWTDLSPTVQQTTNGVLGTAKFDTGWIGMAAPGQGDQYRVFVTGFYIDGTGQKVQVTPTSSTAVTPLP